MESQKKRTKIYGYPGLLADRSQHFCPGCSHGILATAIAGVIQELGLEERSVGVYGPGCAAIMYEYIEVGGVAAPPGGAIGVASGIKRALRDRAVFAYLGEGDLLSHLSTAMGAAMRGERITVICENNFNLAMSGGALSPATPLGAVTTTTPLGRSVEGQGYPVAVADLFRDMKGVAYLARASSHAPGAVRRARSMIRRAFLNQLFGTGMSFVEVLGMCPTNLGVPPVETSERIRELLEALPTGEWRRP